MNCYDLSRVRVLIVEDSPFMAKLLVAMMQAFGTAKSKSVSTRTDFINAVRDYRPDLILTDWNLPGFSGSEVADIVRKSQICEHPFTPIIAISGHTEQERISEMLRHGVDDVIVKPVSSGKLLERINRLIADPPNYVKGGDYLGPERNLKHLGVRVRVA